MKGYYRRRRGILEHLQAGRISLFDAGVHDFLCLNAQSRVGIGSAIPPGIWIGSARKIWLLTSRGERERRIRRSLERLERLGWIKRWRDQGQKGDRPILISRFVVRDMSGNDFIVSAEDTTDWRDPILVPCRVSDRDLSVKRPRRDREASGLLQEVNNEQEKKDTLGRSAPGATVAPRRLLEIWQEEHGPLPAIRFFSHERERKCRARLSSHAEQPGEFLTDFRAAVSKAVRIPFLRGEGERGWKADFDWFVANDTNYLRVLEGKYDGDAGGEHGTLGAAGKNNRRAPGRGTQVAGTLRESAGYSPKPSEI